MQDMPPLERLLIHFSYMIGHVIITMAHEVRTPINIRQCADSVMDVRMTYENERALHSICNEFDETKKKLYVLENKHNTVLQCQQQMAQSKIEKKRRKRRIKAEQNHQTGIPSVE